MTNSRGGATAPRVSRMAAFLETPDLLEDATSVLRSHAERLGETFYYFFGGVKKVLITTDPAVLHRVLKENYENYPKSDIQVRGMGEFLGDGLLTSHGEPWIRKRRHMQKAFSPRQLEAMAGDMAASLEAAWPAFEAAAAKGPVEVGQQMTRAAFPMVMQTLFSGAMGEDEMRQISDGISTIQAFMVRRIVQPFLQPWFLLNGALERHQAIRRAGDAILLRHVRARRDAPRTPPDLLQILLDEDLSPDGGRLTDEEVLAEGMQVLVAGHETSSTALTWTLYLLCQHPTVMAAVREELETVVGDGFVTPSHLSRLRQTTHVIDEALRLYPPFWMIDREAETDDEAGGVRIPRGTTVVAFVHGSHHDRAHWSDPESFCPARFSRQDGGGAESTRYLPFGAGPRRCIGANFAMLQMVMILNAVVRRYDFTLAREPAVRPHPRIIQGARDGVWMTFEPLTPGNGKGQGA
ncbi:MAG: cytochrome [Caulobacter sp.]|nr:cytochrome [Caulobacter sp.]